MVWHVHPSQKDRGWDQSPRLSRGSLNKVDNAVEDHGVDLLLDLLYRLLGLHHRQVVALNSLSHTNLTAALKALGQERGTLCFTCTNFTISIHPASLLFSASRRSSLAFDAPS